MMPVTTRIERITLIREEFDLVTGLAEPSIFPEFPNAIVDEAVLSAVEATHPVDGVEVVGWMHDSAAAHIVIDGMCEDYNRLGSFLSGKATDPRYPGLRVGKCTVLSQSGETIRRQGYGVLRTPYGDYRIYVGRANLQVFKDLITWATAWRVGWIQWSSALLVWQELAKTPIEERVRFASVGGFVTPNFFLVRSRFPAPIVLNRIGVTSDRDQSIRLTLRSNVDWSRVVAEDTLEVREGESEIRYVTHGFPHVPSLVFHFQPEDGTQTILDYLTTIP